MKFYKSLVMKPLNMNSGACKPVSQVAVILMFCVMVQPVTVCKEHYTSRSKLNNEDGSPIQSVYL